MKAIILTQATCPNCDSQKLFMKAAFGDKLDGKVEFIKKEDNEELFWDWIQKAEVMSTPSTLFVENDEIIETVIGFNPGILKGAIEKYL